MKKTVIAMVASVAVHSALVAAVVWTARRVLGAEKTVVVTPSSGMRVMRVGMLPRPAGGGAGEGGEAAEVRRAAEEKARAGPGVERAHAVDERARAGADVERARAEAERAAAEASREVAEKARAGADVERARAEAERDAAEASRAAADKASADVERARAAAERGAANAERDAALAAHGASTSAGGALRAGAGGTGASTLPLGPGLGAEGVGGVDTAKLHALLAAAAERCYPPAAKNFRLRGACDVRFCVGPTGEARDIELRTSTGSPVLDGAARSCVVQEAAPFPRDIVAGCYLVPVRFGR